MKVEVKYFNVKENKWDNLKIENLKNPETFDEVADSFDRIIIALYLDNDPKVKVMIINNQLDINEYKKKVTVFSTQEWQKIFGINLIPVDIVKVFPEAELLESKTL